MPKILNIKVYQYDELTEEAKEKAIKDLFDINVNLGDWYEWVLEDWTTKLEAMGFEDIDIQFSGFYSQGDGASFTAKNIDITKYIESQGLSNRFRVLLDVLNKEECRIEGRVKRCTWHYSHEHTVDVEMEFYWDEEDIPIGRESRAEFLLDVLKDCIEDDVRRLSREIYRDLQKEYEFRTSEEAIVDTIKCNELDFWPSGRTFAYG